MAGSWQFSGVTGRIKVRAETMRAPVVHLLTTSNQREIECVRWFTGHLHRPGVRPFALAANRLSNGSLYLLIAALFWLTYGLTWAVVAAAAAMAFGHLLYPLIKRRYCRRRPFRFDATVPSLLDPLDDHSFPSGHMMSCVAVLTPLCVAVPAILPGTIAIIAIVGWARLVAGHHYPSDLVGGSALGFAVALPVVAVQVNYA